MLKNIPKNLSPELIKVLMEMGHGDEIVIADGNYPAASNAKQLVRCDGLGVPELLESILKLLPMDTYQEYSIGLMKVAEGDPTIPVIWDDYKKIIKEAAVENEKIELITRQEFYDRGKEAYAIVATGEEAIYANILLKKGVVH
ncbi:RbsD/FucU family protein [Vagococcus carniphilus]|uniref:RbsD/FucU domain-containing protein n=1 Tax=Vagococcus carniphilus TaxID=218144 RepID=A0AAW8TYZ2_9ENTE|nr:RbsD/FucU domain-containing protein [Vagococcus carniphilus]MDT2813932.1 RbsD/FucU domain-containing protein [Vagococcus carniphilus]MDT2830498.1 RbsD/FucU domain-containing protein [Vagococcus carniphilus]MDT2832533.1 RbsD/FucU domain-containing protein [Vagococcus carniphilus]MDT2839796.1 RbsD/FucU domain-containing protein [Vagococcus carniphilus]MDT2854757.1 RbsD/FucU domain-containing protein [Vagococcus carniphilus]